MPVSVTYHGDNVAKLNFRDVETIGGQKGNRFEVTDGAASDPIIQSGLYKIKATGDCYVRIGSGISDGTGGEHWYDGQVEIRAINADEKIGCSALS